MEALLSEILQPGFLDPANEDFSLIFAARISLSLSLSEQKSERNHRCMSKPTDRKTSTEEQRHNWSPNCTETLACVKFWIYCNPGNSREDNGHSIMKIDCTSHLVDEKIFCADVSYGPLQHMIY
jgi:hypothetical protein